MKKICSPTKRFFFVFLILISVLNLSYSQKFKPGFVVNSSGDTTKGFINYQLKNRDKVSFKSEFKGQTQTYSPSELSAFGFVQGRFYTSENFNLGQSQSGLLFFENLITGALSLYKDDQVFIIKKGDRIIEIIKPETIDLPEEKAKQRRKNTIAVSSLLVDCNKSLIAETGFKESDKGLVRLVKAYHECIGSDYVEYNNEKAWARVFTTLMVGYTNSKLSFFDNEAELVDDLQIDNVNSLVIGGELLLNSPRTSEHLGLILGLQYQKTDYYGFADMNRSQRRTRNDVIFETSFLRIPIGFNYQVYLKSWPINLKAGGVINTILSYNQKRDEFAIGTNPFLNNIQTTILVNHSDEIVNDKSYEGYWFGVGTEKVVSDKFDLVFEIRYERNSSFAKTLVANITSIQFLVGIKL